MDALTIRSAEFRHASSASMTVRMSDGSEIAVLVTPDSIGNYYTTVHIKRPGARLSEKVVQCMNDGIHCLVARGLRRLI